MQPSHFFIGLLLALIGGTGVYVGMALFARRSDTFSDYFYAGRSLSSRDFIDTSVAYAFQVATLSAFLAYGYIYGFWAVLVPLSWGAGFYVLQSFVSRGRFDSFLLQNEMGTLHQFLGRASMASILAPVAAIASITGLVGSAMYEVWAVSDLLANAPAIITSQSSDALTSSEVGAIGALRLIFYVVLIGIPTTYMLYGGFRAVVTTNRMQLLLGFLGFHAVGISLCFMAVRAGGSVSAVFFSGMGCVLFGAVCLRWILSRRLLPIDGGIFIPVLSFVLYLCATGYFLYSSEAGSSISGFLSSQKFFAPASVFVLPIFGLLFANLVYQLIDVTQWQRLASLQFDGNALEISRNRIVSSLKSTAVYSTANWILAIFMGMLLRDALGAAVSAEPYSALKVLFEHLVSAKDILHQLIALLFVLGLLGVMFSTFDSLISAVSFTAANDLMWGRPASDLGLRRARTVTLAVVIASGTVFYWAMEQVEVFIELLFVFWACQLSLVPTVVRTLLNGSVRPSAAVGSIVCGYFAAFLPVVWNRFVGVSNVEWGLDLYAAIPSSILVSTLVLLACDKKQLVKHSD